MGIFRTNKGERGNIATVLFGAVAMVGVVSAATMQMISGPIRTASQVNNKNLVESQLQIGARLIVLNAATTDDDGDTTIEPIEHDGVNIGLTGGGGIPVSTGASLTDPWNSPYGYCVWDNGVDTTIDAGENRLSGDNTGSALAIALISAGPNRVFETDCYDYSGSPTGVDKPSGSDDYVFKYTYAEAAQTGAGLWEIGATNPDDDVVVKSSGGAETVVVDKELGIGTFMGLVTPLLVGNGGAGNNELEISAAGGLGINISPPEYEFHLESDRSETALFRSSQNAWVGAETTNSSTGSSILFLKTPDKQWNVSVIGTDAVSVENDFSIQETDPGITRFVIEHTTGNVGIGTNDPAVPLHVNGNILSGQTGASPFGTGNAAPWRSYGLFTDGLSFFGTQGSYAADIAWNFYRQTSPVSTINVLGINGSDTANQIRLFDSGIEFSSQDGMSDGDGFPATRMKILADGNVGIGETNPLVRLHIQSNADTANSNFQGGVPMLRLEGANASWSEPAIDFAEQSNAPIARIAANNTGSGAGDLHFMTRVAAGSLTSRMMIKDNGNVGVGTPNPLTKFHVNTATNQNLHVTANTNGGYAGAVGIVSINDANSAYAPLGFAASNYVFKYSNVQMENHLYLQDANGADSKTAALYSYNDLLYFRRHANGSNAFEANVANINLLNGDMYIGGNARIDGGYITNGANEVMRFNDGWVRLNQSGHFNNGVYTPYNLRVDGAVYLNADRNIDTPTGQYGTIQVNGTGTGGYTGYSIDGNHVFMSNGSNTGLYNDVDNEWMLLNQASSYLYLYYDGVWRLRTTSGGVEVNNTLAFASDRRLKENIAPVENALDKLSQINGVSYNWKDKETHDDKTHLGVIAQDVETVFPELVIPSKDDKGNDYLTVNYNGLIAPMIESIKELHAENKSLKERLHKLESEVNGQKE